MLDVTDLLKCFYILLYKLKGDRKAQGEAKEVPVLTVTRDTIENLDDSWVNKLKVQYVKDIDSYRISLKDNDTCAIIKPSGNIILPGA